jgi:hypothetical protein
LQAAAKASAAAGATRRRCRRVTDDEEGERVFTTGRSVGPLRKNCDREASRARSAPSAPPNEEPEEERRPRDERAVPGGAPTRVGEAAGDAGERPALLPVHAEVGALGHVAVALAVVEDDGILVFGFDRGASGKRLAAADAVVHHFVLGGGFDRAGGCDHPVTADPAVPVPDGAGVVAR